MKVSIKPLKTKCPQLQRNQDSHLKTCRNGTSREKKLNTIFFRSAPQIKPALAVSGPTEANLTMCTNKSLSQHSHISQIIAGKAANQLKPRKPKFAGAWRRPPSSSSSSYLVSARRQITLWSLVSALEAPLSEG